MDRKYIFIGGMVLFLFLGIALFLFGGREINKEYSKRDKTKVENHIMYVSAGSLIKLNIEESYENCDEGKCLRQLLIKSYELIDSKANNIYAEVDLLQKHTLNAVLKLIIKTAEDDDVKVKDVKLYTDANDVESVLDISDEYKLTIEVDTAENLILLHEGEEALEKNTTTAIDKKVSKKFSLKGTNVTFKNKKDGYKYSVDEDVILSVTAKGMSSEIEKIKDLKVYVNVKSLSEGKKKIKVYVENDLEEVTFTVSPSSISVNVVNNNRVPTPSDPETPEKPEKPNDDNEEPTTKPVQVERDGINLNDDIEYSEVGTCYSLIYIDDECLSSTIADLKLKYENYNKDLDSSDKYKDDDKFNKDDVTDLIEYFPSCKLDITSNIESKLNSVAGFNPKFNTSTIEPVWIKFKDSKYDKYIGSVDYSKYSLYPNKKCGGSDEGQYKVLDESTCKKFNLTCDRW